MHKNIRVVYLLTVFKYSWFWLGIWVFYYLQFTDYAGIGLIESAMLIAMTVGEIPTGAVADLLGRKFTLITSFIIQTLGLALIGFAANISWLVAGVFVAGIGNSFYSGTLEALVFDSLKADGKENKYPQIIARINAVSLIIPAIAGLAGGFLYGLEPRIPFLLHAAGYACGIITCLALQEPAQDRQKISWNGFVSQNKLGFRQLTRSPQILQQTLFLVLAGSAVVITDEMLNSFLGVEFGFSAQQLGVFWAVAYLAGAAIGLLAPALIRRLSINPTIIFLSTSLGLTLIVSPWIGLGLGMLTIFVRFGLQSLFNNAASTAINQHTASGQRATTLSTYNMLKNIPYVLTAFFIGRLADWYSARTIAAALGGLLVIGCLLLVGDRKKFISDKFI